MDEVKTSAIRVLLATAFLAAVLIYGWFYAPEAPPLNANGTHLLGLKFVPACTPQLMNATCGYDIIYTLGLLALFLLIATFI